MDLRCWMLLAAECMHSIVELLGVDNREVCIHDSFACIQLYSPLSLSPLYISLICYFKKHCEVLLIIILLSSISSHLLSLLFFSLFLTHLRIQIYQKMLQQFRFDLLFIKPEDPDLAKPNFSNFSNENVNNFLSSWYDVGFKGLFRGSIPRIAWYIPASALTFMAVECLRDRFNSNNLTRISVDTPSSTVHEGSMPVN